MSGELTEYRLVKYVRGMTYSRAQRLISSLGWTSFDEVDEWVNASPRRQADQCCDTCRKLPGKGPWCGMCGREQRDQPRLEGTWFTYECAECSAETIWTPPRGERVAGVPPWQAGRRLTRGTT